MNETVLVLVATAVGSAATAMGVLTAWLTSRAAAKLALQQSEIAAHATAAEWLRDVRSWASEAINVLSEASYACKVAQPVDTDSITATLRECRHRISALIDRGRYFFPNQSPEAYGVDKPLAFRGYRHAVLDPLVAVEQVLGGSRKVGAFNSVDSAVVYLRREFVSRVFRVLSPESHNEQIARLIWLSNAGRATDPTLGGLLPDAGTIPTGAGPLLDIAARKAGPQPRP